MFPDCDIKMPLVEEIIGTAHGHAVARQVGRMSQSPGGENDEMKAEKSRSMCGISIIFLYSYI
jgi:hypothetical protein